MEYTLKKVCVALLLLSIGLASFLFASGHTASPDTHKKTIEALDSKVTTVLELAAASTLASAGISALPGDAATPIADKLADFTEYFLLVLCVLYAEKYLITILGMAAFRVLIPIACVLFAASVFWKPEITKKLGFKLVVFGLALYVTIPLSINVSDMIYDTYQASIETTLDAAQEFSDDSLLTPEETEEGGILGSLVEKITAGTGQLGDKAANVLNNFTETLAVMIVTSCIIPILVLIFFIWLIKLITGIDIPVTGRFGKKHPKHPEPEA